jgi:hypothetical protein
MTYHDKTPVIEPVNRRFGRSAPVAAIAVTAMLLGCPNTPAESSDPPSVAKQSSPPQPAPTVSPPTAPPAKTVPLAAVSAGPLRVEPGAFDFGMIGPKSIHAVNATLYNTGAVPITIIKVSPSCACTTPQDLTDTVIPPGGSVPFSATFSAPTEPGVKNAYVQLVFRYGRRQAHAKINFQGVITMPVRADLPYVDALKGVTTGRTRVESVDGRPFRIISANGTSPVYVDGFDPQTDQPRNAYEVQWNIPPRTVENCKGMRLWWVIETDHPDCPILPMRVRHECTGLKADPDWRQRDWRFPEYIAQLGALHAGMPAEVDIDIVNENNVRIFAVQSGSSDADAELVSTSPKEGEITTYRVRLTPRRGFQGMLYAMVLFHSDTGSHDIAFIGRVMP